MKKVIFAFLALGIVLPALAQTACAPPAQAKPNFSGPYTIAAGATLAVNWTPSPTPGCTTYFTLNAQPPTTSSSVYTGQQIQLSQTTTILMIAMGPGMTSSQQQGGQWVITGGGGSGTPPIAGKAIALSCTPSTGSTAKNPGTTTLFRATAPSTNFTQIASGLPPTCTFTDTNTVAGTAYSYYAIAVIGGQSSVPSASTIPLTAPPAITTPIAPTLAVSFAPTTIDNETAVVATITASGTPAPTGTVTLTSGAFSSAAATLANGSASITIPANSLDVGALVFTATYTPDAAGASNYASATGTGTLVVTPVPPTALAGTVAQ